MNILGRIIFTAVEALTLAGWLALVRAELAVLGIGVLVAGFALEHIISYNTRHARPFLQLSGVSLGNIGLLSGIETVTWAVWLSLTDGNPVVAAAALFTGLIIGHVLELNIMNDFAPLYRVFNRLRHALDFTAIETGGGIVWLALTGAAGTVIAAAINFVFLFVEHTIAGNEHLSAQVERAITPKQ